MVLDASYLVAASALAQCLLLGRILLLGIWRSSSGICSLLIWGITSSSTYLLMHRGLTEPLYLWPAGYHVIPLIFFAVAVRSMTNHILGAYEGILLLERKFFGLMLLLAILLLVVTGLSTYWGEASSLAPALYSCGLILRIGLTLYWAILLGFSIWFRITPSRNTLVHGTCLAAYLGVDCIGSIISEQATPPQVIAAEVVIFSVWAILISREAKQARHLQARQTG